MKRFFCLLFALVLLPVVSLADLPDISSLSYVELVQLRNQINLAMWNSQQWQEVSVPPGIWEIGVDIPAGHWSVRPAAGCGPDYIIYASSTKDQGHDVDILAGEHIMECICDHSAPYYSSSLVIPWLDHG